MTVDEAKAVVKDIDQITAALSSPPQDQKDQEKDPAAQKAAQGAAQIISSYLLALRVEAMRVVTDSITGPGGTGTAPPAGANVTGAQTPPTYGKGGTGAPSGGGKEAGSHSPQPQHAPHR
jgi:hypothetical protein